MKTEHLVNFIVEEVNSRPLNMEVFSYGGIGSVGKSKTVEHLAQDKEQASKKEVPKEWRMKFCTTAPKPIP